MNPLPPLVLKGDALTELARIPDNSIDSIVTDPPYGLANTDPAHVVEALTKWATGDREFIPEGRGFMGKAWDAFVPPPAVWDECLRVLKPGGHLLAFAGSRTFDLMTLSIRFAGFDIRDSIAWLYGSGFPKSMDVSKAIDKIDAADERLQRARRFQAFVSPHLTAKRVDELTGTNMGYHLTTHPTQPSVATADLFDKLRPHLPAVPNDIEEMVAERTVESKNYAARAVTGQHEQAIARGPAGLTAAGKGKDRRDDAHTDAAREWQGWGTALKPAFEPIVVARKPFPRTVAANVLAHGTGALNIDATRVETTDDLNGGAYAAVGGRSESASLHAGSGMNVPGATTGKAYEQPSGRWPANVILDESQADTFDESKFFYVAKAPKSERPVVDGVAHPTVKPLTLMRQLVKLVTPPDGVVLEPFAGSGTTLEAAYLEGFESIGIEMTADYWPLIQARIERVTS